MPNTAGRSEIWLAIVAIEGLAVRFSRRRTKLHRYLWYGLRRCTQLAKTKIRFLRISFELFLARSSCSAGVSRIFGRKTRNRLLSSLTELAARASKGHVVGADASELMIKIATQRNRHLIAAARIEVVNATAEFMPFPDDSCDKVLCVHVLYFWRDLDRCLRETARVLKPGGRLGLLFRTKADLAAVASFPAEIYRFRALAEVAAALEQADLDLQAASDCTNEPVLLLARKTARLE